MKIKTIMRSSALSLHLWASLASLSTCWLVVVCLYVLLNYNERNRTWWSRGSSSIMFTSSFSLFSCWGFLDNLRFNYDGSNEQEWNCWDSLIIMAASVKISNIHALHRLNLTFVHYQSLNNEDKLILSRLFSLPLFMHIKKYERNLFHFIVHP